MSNFSNTRRDHDSFYIQEDQFSNPKEYFKKALFETFVIFKFYGDEYGLLNYYYELNDLYEKIYRRDNSQDKKIQSGFRVIVGGLQ